MVHGLLKGIFNLLHSTLFGSLLKIWTPWHAQICSSRAFCWKKECNSGKRNVIYSEWITCPRGQSATGHWRKSLSFHGIAVLFLFRVCCTKQSCLFLFPCWSLTFYSKAGTIPVNSFICPALYCSGSGFLLGKFLTCTRGEKKEWVPESPVFL